MTAKNTDRPDDDDSLGVLDDAASLDTAGIGILGGTAQVNLTIPMGDDDDLLDDDAVVDGEVASELILDPAPELEPATAADVIGHINDGGFDIVIELPAEELPQATVKDAEDAVTAEVVASEAVAESAPAAPATPAKQPKQTKTKSKPKPLARAAAADAASALSKPTEPVASAAPQTSAPEHIAPDAPATTVARSSSARVATVERAAAGESSDTGEEEEETVCTEKEPRVTSSEASLAPRTAAAPARADIELTSKRLGDQLGQATRESADLLTADRLLDPHQVTKPEPEGAWSHFLYTVSGRRINIGDGKKAKARKALSTRIAAPMSGGARFVPVLSRKGGVGKTTITALLGMALADARDDRVIAVDANPDRGTLAERIVGSHSKSVRDLVRIHDEVRGYHDISAIVARDTTRLDVLASDTDPRIADAFGDADYRDVADVAAHYYSLVLTDTGTGIVHSVMGATLELADQLVIVSGLSVDEARLASETLTWLETNGYSAQARDAIIVLNQSTPGSPLVRLNELEAHFATRARHVVRMPYDPQIAGGGPIVFTSLLPETRQAARELAALLVEGLRASAA
jgi:MinD-like ATPase involved in chromosome partitioning or flagellar assembly